MGNLKIQDLIKTEMFQFKEPLKIHNGWSRKCDIIYLGAIKLQLLLYCSKIKLQMHICTYDLENIYNNTKGPTALINCCKETGWRA